MKLCPRVVEVIPAFSAKLKQEAEFEASLDTIVLVSKPKQNKNPANIKTLRTMR